MILHDFGLVWADADNDERAVLAAEEPEPFDPRWDAFLAAYVEYLCRRDGIEAPEWTRRPGRYLERMWWPADYFEFERGGVIVRVAGNNELLHAKTLTTPQTHEPVTGLGDNVPPGPARNAS